MSENDFYQEFIGIDEDSSQAEQAESSSTLLKSSHPTYLAAVQAIDKLKKEKLRYIKGHFKDSDFKAKKTYGINKAEVAREVDREPGPLFNQNSFSKALQEHFKDANGDLEKAKISQLERKSNGFQNRSKTELVKEVRKVTQEIDDLTKNNCEVLFQMMLDELPLDVKRTLKIKA